MGTRELVLTVILLLLVARPLLGLLGAALAKPRRAAEPVAPPPVVRRPISLAAARLLADDAGPAGPR